MSGDNISIEISALLYLISYKEYLILEICRVYNIQHIENW